MVDRGQLEHLQRNARRSRRVCNFFIDKEGRIDGVFYLDPKSNGRFRVGAILSNLSFAEIEREKPRWVNLPPSERDAGA